VVLDLKMIVLAKAVYFERPIPSLMHESRWIEKFMAFDHTLSLLLKAFSSLILIGTSSMKLTCRISSCGNFFIPPNGLP